MPNNLFFNQFLLYLSLFIIIYFLYKILNRYLRYTKNKYNFLRRFSKITRRTYLDRNDLLMLSLTSDSFYGKIKRILINKNNLPIEIKNKWLLNEVPKLQLLIINILLIVIIINLSEIIKLPSINILLVTWAIEILFLYKIYRKKSLIKNNIDNNLAEILDIMARVYRVNSDLKVSLKEVIRNISDPSVKEIFKDILKLSKFGYSIEQSFDAANHFIGSKDFEFVVEAIKINTKIGGNLSNLFEKLSEIIRLRKEASYEVANVMFQSKISAIISSLLVPVIIALGFLTNNDYKDTLLIDPIGRVIFLVSIIWWTIGVYIIKKTIKVDI